MDNGHQQGILNSWKEIAQYLGRGVRTVQRWEADLGLPVRRPRGKRRSAVIAVTGELDRWMEHRPLHLGDGTDGDGALNSTIHVLVIEDSVTDLNGCVNILRRMGNIQVDAISNIPAALIRMETIKVGKLPSPDLIILDLNFSEASGFEVLRYLRTYPRLREIPVIVWSIIGDTQQELCSIFGVHRVVAKLAGPSELHEAVNAVLSARVRAA